MNQQIALSIVSNSRLLGEGLIALLARRLDVQLVAIYPSQPITANHVANPCDHVALVDSSIGRVAAQSWTHFWCRHTPPTPVVILELLDDVELILASIEAGASGYTLKDASPEEIAETIWLVSQGKALCSPEITAHLFSRLAHLKSRTAENSPTISLLTKREQEVLCLVAQGCSNKEIAEKLCITLRTAKQHVHNILHKLDLKNRHEAAHMAKEHGC